MNDCNGPTVTVSYRNICNFESVKTVNSWATSCNMCAVQCLCTSFWTSWCHPVWILPNI